jgi:LPXTG-motif cell wall-anchored protein
MRIIDRSVVRGASVAGALVCAAGLASTVSAQPTVGPVFVIAMENHNWTQPSNQFSGNQQQIFQNTAAPYINSLVTTGSPNAQYVSWASNYQSVGAAVHPSEPNYIWSEAGTNFGVTNDNDPYSSNNNIATNQHLTGLMQAQGLGWKSYQEGINLTPGSGAINQPGANSLTNTVAPQNQWTVPLKSFSGTSAAYTNQYNGSHQYNYAAKHNPQIFFQDTNGGNNLTSSNPMATHYAPLEQLQADITANTVAPYNFITPDQYNDMHTSLTAGFTYHGVAYPSTDDKSKIAQGDNFLSVVVPMIMASDTFQNHNATIVIWNDETEGETAGTIGQYSSMEIVISKLAKGNAYNSTLLYTHSSDLKTLQELYNVGGSSATGFLGDAANATDLADMFVPGALPNAGASSIPTPGAAALLVAGTLGLVGRRRRA